MISKEWKPTWKPEDLQPGLEAWLAACDHDEYSFNEFGADDRHNPDFRRQAFMLAAVSGAWVMP